MNRVRALLDKILYAGLKPGKKEVASSSSSWFAPVRARWESFLSGGNPRDPLYLSNRSTSQKVLAGALLGLPFLVTGVVFFLWANGYFRSPVERVVVPQQKAVDLLPELKDVRVDNVQLVLVSNILIKHQPSSVLQGVLRNNTRRTLSGLEIVFDLADSNGSGIGAVMVSVDKMEGEAVTTFSIPIKQRNAVTALFRESRAR